jgi:hypothetical protein
MSEDEEQLLHSSEFPPTTGYKAAENNFFLDNMSPFLTFFCFRRAQRVPREKSSK